MAVTFYSSTDASAPAVYGSVNATYNTVNLLDKILVSGYGSKAAAGWTKPYTDTNKAYFKAAGTNGHYLYVDDSAATYARVRGYETVGAGPTPANPFPTEAQLSGGAYHIRSSTSDTTTKPWVCIADNRFFCLVINYDSTGLYGQALMFGNIDSYRTDDAYDSILVAGSSSSYSSNIPANTASLSSSIGGHWMARSYTQLGSSITVGQHSDYYKAGLAYPHPVDGGLYLGPLWVHENALSVVRGQLPGVWIPLHTGNRPLAHGDTFSGTGALAGKTFIQQNVYSSMSLMLETSDTW